MKNNLKLAFSCSVFLQILNKLNKSMELSATFRDMETFIRGLQDQICNGLEAFEPIQRFQQDIWEKGAGWWWLDKNTQWWANLWKSRSKYLFHPWRDDKELASQLKVEEGLFGGVWAFTGHSSKFPKVPTVHMNVGTLRQMKAEAGLEVGPI